LNNQIDSFLEEILEQEPKTGLAYLIHGYALCSQSEGKSKNYISLVSTSMKLFIHFLERSDFSTNATKIEIQHVRRFIIHLQSVERFASHPFTRPQQTRLSGHTISAYLRSVRAFFSWLEVEGIIVQNPFSKLRIPKAPGKVTPTFSEHQLHAFFGVIDTSTAEGFRDYALFATYTDTACRLAEITGLRINDVDLGQGVLRVLGKGNRERLVPIGVTVQKTLYKYFAFSRPEPAIANCDRFFLTKDGRPLMKNRVEAIMRKYGEKAGIEGVRCSPHTLRHTACVMWIRNGGDIFSLQRITGHSSLEVLRGYVNLAQSDVNAAHRRNSPIDNLDLRMPRSQRRRK